MDIKITEILLVLTLFSGGSTAVKHCGPFEKKENGNCIVCPVCPAGTGLPSDCGFGHGAGLKCESCVKGVTFRGDPKFEHSIKCQLCTNCTFYNRQFEYHCREVVDAECGECLPDFYDVNPWPSICHQCSPDVSFPACDNYRQRLFPEFTEIIVTSGVSPTQEDILEESIDQWNFYKWSTWILAVFLGMIVFVIIYKIRVNRCHQFRYHDPQECNLKDIQCSKRIVKEVENRPLLKKTEMKTPSLPITGEEREANQTEDDNVDILNELQDGDDTSALLRKSFSTRKTTIKHVKSSTKVLRSISDPGPTTSCNFPVFTKSVTASSKNAEPSAPECSGVMNHINDEDIVIQVPPAVVHMACDLMQPIMAIPFHDDLSGGNNLNVPMLDLLLPDHRSQVSVDVGSFPYEDTDDDFHEGSEGISRNSNLIDNIDSEASTLMIRSMMDSFPTSDIPSMPDLNDLNRMAGNDGMNGTTTIINGNNMINEECRNNNVNDSSHSNNARATTDNEPNNTPTVSSSPPNNAIIITINNNITTTTGIPGTPPAENTPPRDEFPPEEFQNGGVEESSDLTIPKYVDVAINRPAASCGTQHASVYSKQFHCPIQESVHVNSN